MATKRMLSKVLLESDLFLDLPLSAQALYMHLNIQADDDGFVSGAKRIQRSILAQDDDLKLLIENGLAIVFKDVILLTHWHINNYIRSDRYTPTLYQEQFESVLKNESGLYEIIANNELGIPNDNQEDTERIPDSNQRYTDGSQSGSEMVANGMQMVDVDKYSTDKNRLDKNSVDKSIVASDETTARINYLKKFFESNPLLGAYRENTEKEILEFDNLLSIEVVNYALEKTATKHKKYGYAKTMLQRWADDPDGPIKTIEQVQAFDQIYYSNEAEKAKKPFRVAPLNEQDVSQGLPF